MDILKIYFKQHNKNTLLKNGFTLSEVLITLVIIGVIAAITIPAVKQSLENTEYKTQYKKAHSDLSNAVLQSVALGEFPYRDHKYDTELAAEEWEIMKKNFRIQKLCEDNDISGCWKKADTIYSGPNTSSSKAFIDMNGRAWATYSNRESYYLVDTNGDKGPNKFGKDRFGFVFSDAKGNPLCDTDSIQNDDCSKLNNTGYPAKVMPKPNHDVTSYDSGVCHYPPCYYVSWLL